MSAEELRELDSWIEENIFGRRRVEAGTHYHWPSQQEIDDLKEACPELAAVSYISAREFTTNDADAMAVLKVCAQKIEETKFETDCVQIQWYDGQWNVCGFEGDIPTCSAPTLPEAICLFAKKLHGG